MPAGLILLVGPPGSGKSSFARAGVASGHLDARRSGPAHVPTDELRHYAAIAAHQTSRDRLLSEGADVVIDVPGEADGSTPAAAAATIHLSA